GFYGMNPKDVNNLLSPISPLHEGISSYGLSCLVTRRKAISSDELRKFAAELMITVAQSCTDSGAKDIGHIKAFIEHDNGFLHANTVGDPADVTVEGRDGEPINHFKLVINSVIYGLSKDAVINATEASVKTVRAKLGLEEKAGE
ncbi:MAG: hypothetical protein KAR15_18370, partial [Desulfobacterales bacterium]|nr:hypothetical protein [Desulfobacterales bacterium]